MDSADQQRRLVVRRGTLKLDNFTLSATYLSPFVAQLSASGAVTWALALTNGFGLGQVRHLIDLRSSSNL